jgi:hypothetical protein
LNNQHARFRWYSGASEHIRVESLKNTFFTETLQLVSFRCSTQRKLSGAVVCWRRRRGRWHKMNQIDDPSIYESHPNYVVS